jgi:hypothetical protein
LANPIDERRELAMASVTKRVAVQARAEDVWAALRDFGAIHRVLAPGFVLDARVERQTRVITFFNGAAARELLVDIDDATRRLAYSVIEGPLGFTHHNASAQVSEDGNGGCQFVWIADVLPDEVAEPMGELMERGIHVIKETLEVQGRGLCDLVASD